MSNETTPTMRQVLDLIGTGSVEELLSESDTHPGNEPLRRVNDLLVAALEDIEHGERVMRREASALKDAADREVSLLEQGYATTDWPAHFAGKVEAGRQQINHGVDTVKMLAPLRKSLLP